MEGNVINKDLLRETLAYIEAHPEEWDQTKWICESVACFAGRACLLSGDRPIFDPKWRFEAMRVAVGELGHDVGVRRRATDLLGIDEWQADDLFAQKNTLNDLRRIVAELCERE